MYPRGVASTRARARAYSFLEFYMYGTVLCVLYVYPYGTGTCTAVHVHVDYRYSGDLTICVSSAQKLVLRAVAANDDKCKFAGGLEASDLCMTPLEMCIVPFGFG